MPSKRGRIIINLPKAAEAVIQTYDSVSGYYKTADGEADFGHTEAPVLTLWYSLVRSVRPRMIVETGVYQGLSTCFLAAGLRDNGEGEVHGIDPLETPHLWEGSELEKYITWHAETSQDALPAIQDIAPIDMLLIDSEHTYAQSSWELAEYEPLVAEGGYILLHDCLWHDGVGRTVQHLLDSDRFEVVIFETPRAYEHDHMKGGRVSMGLAVARKIQSGSPLERDPAWIDVPERAPQGPEPLLRRHAYDRSVLRAQLTNEVRELRAQLETLQRFADERAYMVQSMEKQRELANFEAGPVPRRPGTPHAPDS